MSAAASHTISRSHGSEPTYSTTVAAVGLTPCSQSRSSTKHPMPMHKDTRKLAAPTTIAVFVGFLRNFLWFGMPIFYPLYRVPDTLCTQ